MKDIGKNANMNLTILGPDVAPQEFEVLNNYCKEQAIDLTFEYIEGQFWLHSDDKKERPIGIQIDKELQRHEDFFKRSSRLKELLARAVGLKSGVKPKILDLTGGTLGDTLLFLSFGLEVVTLERHPVVAFLIKSALENSKHPALNRMTFLPVDALSYLSQKPAVDVVYFDPMFEDVNDDALPKKEMRIFRSLVGSDQDAQEVFSMARSLNPKRIVIKRPRLSVPLAPGPQIVFKGKATRYDVYLT